MSYIDFDERVDHEIVVLSHSLNIISVMDMNIFLLGQR